MKVARCRSSAVSPSAGSTTSTAWNTKCSTWSPKLEHLVEKYGISEITPENLYINGLISQTDRVKVLGNGELKAKLSFKVHAVSEKAKSAIEGTGGTIEILK